MVSAQVAQYLARGNSILYECSTLQIDEGVYESGGNFGTERVGNSWLTRALYWYIVDNK